MCVHLLDIEWLLSTLFDASLLYLRAAGNGGSFFMALGRPVPERSATGGPGNYVTSFRVAAAGQRVRCRVMFRHCRGERAIRRAAPAGIRVA
jgi:hypothetical protein